MAVYRRPSETKALGSAELWSPKLGWGGKEPSLPSIVWAPGPSPSGPPWCSLGTWVRQQGGPSSHHPSQRSVHSLETPASPQLGFLRRVSSLV